MIKLLAKLEIDGIKVDDRYLKKLSEKFKERLKKIEKKSLNFLAKNLIFDHQSS